MSASLFAPKATLTAKMRPTSLSVFMIQSPETMANNHHTAYNIAQGEYPRPCLKLPFATLRKIYGSKRSRPPR